MSIFLKNKWLEKKSEIMTVLYPRSHFASPFYSTLIFVFLYVDDVKTIFSHLSTVHWLLFLRKISYVWIRVFPERIRFHDYSNKTNGYSR